MTHYDIAGILPGAEPGAQGTMPSIHMAPPPHPASAAPPAVDDTILITPAMAVALYNAGIARRHLRDFGGAIRDFDLALRLDPTHEGAKFELKLLRGD